MVLHYPPLYEQQQMIPLAQYQELERKLLDLDEKYCRVIDEQDLIYRTLRSPKMTSTDKMLYLALVELCPCLIDGVQTSVKVHEVRQRAGWVSETAATSFFQNMHTINAISYNSGSYNRKLKEHVGLVIPCPDVFPYPEFFDLVGTEKRRKANAGQKAKAREAREALLILQCEECGSPSIKYGLLPQCKSCGHKHAALEGIAAERISIKPDEGDDWFDESVHEVLDEAFPLGDMPDEMIDRAFGPKKARG